MQRAMLQLALTVERARPAAAAAALSGEDRCLQGDHQNPTETTDSVNLQACMHALATSCSARQPTLIYLAVDDSHHYAESRS